MTTLENGVDVSGPHARCEDCDLPYPVEDLGLVDVPVTAYPYTCDDCGGYVDVVGSS